MLIEKKHEGVEKKFFDGVSFLHMVFSYKKVTIMKMSNKLKRKENLQGQFGGIG